MKQATLAKENAMAMDGRPEGLHYDCCRSAALQGCQPDTPRLRGRAIARSSVSERIQEAMFALMASHFTGVDRRVFQADLAEKSDVILLLDEENVLRGFSTLQVYRTRAAGRPVTIVYSGDTIVDRECWGSHALARTWIDAVRRATSGAGTDVYWLLITSGYRTYRFLPVFYRSFFPRFDEPTPLAEQALLHDVASERFGSRYDRPTGVVRFDRPQVLADDLLFVPPGRAADPHVCFFLERNPGFVFGDELVCLTRIHDDNLTPAGRRLARSRS